MGLLEKQKAIVTGGASGIGAATCRRFAEEGASVVVLDRNAEAAVEVAQAIGGRSVHADVADSQAFARALDSSVSELGGIDVLVNNAGVSDFRAFDQMTIEAWENMVRINLTSAFVATQTVSPHMKKAGRGVIINNASGSAVKPTRGEVGYSVSKAGMVALTQGAAQELAPEIRVNAISPGIIHTPMTAPLVDNDEMMRPALEAMPLGRIGTDDEVADVMVFLASDLSRYVTGQNLVVDGGIGVPQSGIDEVLGRLLSMLKTS